MSLELRLLFFVCVGPSGVEETWFCAFASRSVLLFLEGTY